MSATTIDPEREEAARDSLDAELQALKRENRQNRRALDHVLTEINLRMAESPRQRLATDLLNILAANPELVQSGVQGATWKDLPEMAEKCLEAAGKIFPEPPAIPAIPPVFGRDFDPLPPPPAAVEGAQAVSGGLGFGSIDTRDGFGLAGLASRVTHYDPSPEALLRSDLEELRDSGAHEEVK